MTDRRALTAAARMGTRAGVAFRTTGTPSPNPFTGKAAELAAAWRRAYFAATRAP
jgi:hypothetical protein